MRKLRLYACALLLSAGLIGSTVAVANAQVSPDRRDTNWPCEGC